MGNYHARCGVGEKPEVVTPEAYLSLFGQIPNFDKLIATIRSREISASIRDRQTRDIVENTIRKLDAIPEPECRRFIADTKQRFIQNRDNSIRRRLAEAKAQARTKKPHPKRKEPDRERS